MKQTVCTCHYKICQLDSRMKVLLICKKKNEKVGISVKFKSYAIFSAISLVFTRDVTLTECTLVCLFWDSSTNFNPKRFGISSLSLSTVEFVLIRSTHYQIGLFRIVHRKCKSKQFNEKLFSTFCFDWRE